MQDKCPGSEKRNIRPEEMKCPYCGEVLEIFSDELKAWCLKCKKFVYRDRKIPECFDWCPYAEKCKLEMR